MLARHQETAEFNVILYTNERHKQLVELINGTCVCGMISLFDNS